MNRFLCLLLVPFVAAACADEVAPADNNVIDHLGAGTMVINVSGLDSVAVGAMVKLIVDRTSSPAANNFVVKERPLEGALFVLDQVFVPEAVYRVTVELRDANGQVFLKGTTSGVSVLQGQTTSVMVVLEPSGAVQVVAELAETPNRFILTEFSSDDADPVQWLSGAQHVIQGAAGVAEIEYLVLVSRPSPPAYSQVMIGRAKTPLALLGDTDDFEPTTGLAFGYGTVKIVLTAAGGALFATRINSTGDVAIFRGDAQELRFELWAAVPSAPQQLVDGNYLGQLDGLTYCQALFDSQLNLLCAIRRRKSFYSDDYAVVRSYSEGGTAWSFLPPYVDESGGVVAGDSLPPGTYGDGAPILDALWARPEFDPNTSATSLAVMEDSGVYHLWMYVGGENIGTYASSTDRRSWRELGVPVLERADGGALSLQVSKPFRGFAVFKTGADAKWQMIVVDKNGKRWLATSPVGE